jgi:hypothetical protein
VFSIDDPSIHTQWTVSLKQQMDAVVEAILPNNSSLAPVRCYCAADVAAFKVLLDTRIEPLEHTVASLAINKTLSRLKTASNQKLTDQGGFSQGNGSRSCCSCTKQ